MIEPRSAWSSANFIDGNKRAALLSAGLFLHLNGYRLSVSQVDATLTMFALAAGEMDEADKQAVAVTLRHTLTLRLPMPRNR